MVELRIRLAVDRGGVAHGFHDPGNGQPADRGSGALQPIDPCALFQPNEYPPATDRGSAPAACGIIEAQDPLGGPGLYCHPVLRELAGGLLRQPRRAADNGALGFLQQKL